MIIIKYGTHVYTMKIGVLRVPYNSAIFSKCGFVGQLSNITQKGLSTNKVEPDFGGIFKS